MQSRLIQIFDCRLKKERPTVPTQNNLRQRYTPWLLSDDDEIPLRTLIPVGSAGPTGTYVSGVRKLDVPLAKGDFELPAGSKITVRMFYRSVENGTYGDIVSMPASASDGEGGTIPGAWSNDCHDGRSAVRVWRRIHRIV